MRTTTRITLGICAAVWVGAASVGVGVASTTTPSPTTYTVRSGDTLTLPDGTTTGPLGYHCHPAFGADGLTCARANHLFGY
jgi:hypothetical protein